MTVIQRESVEAFLLAHQGLTDENFENPCLREVAAGLDNGSSFIPVLDATVMTGERPYLIGHDKPSRVLIYRQCARLACRVECALVVDDAYAIVDSRIIQAPCAESER